MYVMNAKILIYSIVVSLAGVLADASVAQTVPQQSATLAVTRPGRVRNPESIKRAKLTRLKKDVAWMSIHRCWEYESALFILWM